MRNRPLSIREIQDRKRRQREEDQSKVKIRNITRMQNVPLQIYGKKSKDAVNQLCIQLGPNKSVELPESRLIKEQIANLKKRRMITVVKTGVSNKDIDSFDYRQFLPKKKDLKVDVTRSSKHQPAKSSTKKNSKSNKSDKSE